MAVTIKPLGPLFGAEILGANLHAPLPPEDVKAIKEAMDKYAVTVVRDADVSDEEQVRFSKYFGALELPPTLGLRPPRIARELYDVSNLTEDNEIAPADAPKRKFSKADNFFHTDSSFNNLPTSWSILSGRILPPEGGNTEFIDMRAVYAALDQETKDIVQDLTAIHSMAHSRKLGGYTMTPEQAAVLPPVPQKMVQTAPDGRPTLVAGSHAGSIIGWPDDKAQELLIRIIEFAKQPRFRLVHKWQPHELLMWDNRCTLHRGTPYDDFKYKRDMRRTTLLEYGPDRSVQDAA